MAEILDCFVNYFSADTNDEGMPRRYLSYHVVAGPGPRAGAILRLSSDGTCEFVASGSLEMDWTIVSLGATVWVVAASVTWSLCAVAARADAARAAQRPGDA